MTRQLIAVKSRRPQCPCGLWYRLELMEVRPQRRSMVVLHTAEFLDVYGTNAWQPYSAGANNASRYTTGYRGTAGASVICQPHRPAPMNLRCNSRSLISRREISPARPSHKNSSRLSFAKPSQKDSSHLCPAKPSHKDSSRLSRRAQPPRG